MLIEAKYYESLDQQKVKCTLCPHECILSLNKTGICRTRKNIDGKLFTLAYSNPCAVNIDPIEKKPLSHFLPSSKTFSIATAGCNLACDNCQNSTISQSSPSQLKHYDISPTEVIKLAKENNCKSISYTYTDPVAFYEYTLETAKIARTNNLKNVIISAGYINPKPLKELIPFIDAANIDLKNFDDNIYKKINKATLKPVLETLKTLKENNIWLEITYLLIPGLNNSDKMLNEMCGWLSKNGFNETPIHLSKYFPTYKMLNYRETNIKDLTKAKEIALQHGIKFIYIGNIAGNNSENTYCPNCNQTLIKRIGYNVLSNNIIEGKCKFCSTNISGIWS
ncbi:MAG: AmmeMemoRadiSam system radical SAM enzyme [Bacteroidales bacterium]|nr:AmmeMemoRadiSam system radical SAM enzyme [Bacteroidales bacterium]